MRDGQRLDVDSVVDVAVKLIAGVRKEDEGETRSWLESAGPEMPIDSILIVAILAKVQKQYGVKLPADAETARAMKSVRTFAEAVVAAAGEEINDDDDI